MFQKITEIKNFREALKDIHFDTWLVLDLDNTVMTPRIAFGGDAWFEGLFSHVSQKKIEPAIAQPSLMSVYNSAQHFVRTSAVEPKIVSIIRALQDIGIPVIGLTARGYSIRHQTLRQLADMGVDFSRNSIVSDDDSTCQGGVIFCAGGDKGKNLNSFLSRLGCAPHHIVMLDDKKKHLERVMIALEPLGIHFSGFRYGYLDEKVQQFSMDAANIQLAHLWEWLSATVQEDVKKLKLISEELMGTLSPLVYSESFFHPEHPLHPSSSKSDVDKPSQEKQSKLLKRSLSSSSFFYKENLSSAPLKWKEIENEHSTNSEVFLRS
ncbi:hypothetical protein Lgra_1339 [Legionella gratiana]|uniref:Protein of uncharacterized function (DUF2608) n=1 Tax=Legionella gratiana TaxID=45066 RepID=A0A378JI26_9GAMM|nr:DUF2608 domain-containing protein [Legionella gratiana]KTD11881.1 hypothetical protein Lgra_1339 [Legionella gratiana]STX46527.1 Protein of uncharacterised function (DUF2608) [Legionella gratiana]